MMHINASSLWGEVLRGLITWVERMTTILKSELIGRVEKPNCIRTATSFASDRAFAYPETLGFRLAARRRMVIMDAVQTQILA
jgi:hypothetical protein